MRGKIIAKRGLTKNRGYGILVVEIRGYPLVAQLELEHSATNRAVASSSLAEGAKTFSERTKGCLKSLL